VGASLKLLTGRNLLSGVIENFIMECYEKVKKNFRKHYHHSKGDPVHTFHSILGLRIIGGNAEEI
jgi:hypothetical protein